jgi:hypothetical protein
LAVWKVPRQCPLVLLVKDLFNFDLKDVGAAVVGESACPLVKTQLYRFVRTSQETHYVSATSQTD